MESAESPLSDAWGHPDADLLATPRKAVTPLGSLRHRTPSRWRDYSGPVDSSLWEYVLGKSGKSFALTRLETSGHRRRGRSRWVAPSPLLLQIRDKWACA